MNARAPKTTADRCEVCRTVLVERPDPRRRRCGDHLDQLVLVPLAGVRGKTASRKTSSRKTGTRTEGPR